MIVDRLASVPLEAKVAALKDPRIYAEAPRSVVAIETHMSWVFLTKQFAYKLKKPVRYPYLDFSTLAAREFNCREEFRLNQRLAPGVYLDVVPLCRADAGRISFCGEGAVIDWLVKMRRLPAERFLDNLIKQQVITPHDVERLANVLVAFYREATPVPLSASDYRARFAGTIGRNREILANPQYALPMEHVRRVLDGLLHCLDASPELFDQRVSEQRIVEGHGDLRPEHVCLEATPIVFDRLEFNAALRITDPVEELAFLSMECERLGAPFVKDVLFRSYRNATGDSPPRALLDFYMAHRACVRARLAALHTEDLPRTQWPHWLTAAADYLRVAARYSDRLIDSPR